MSNFKVSRELLFLDSDLQRPRWAVEKEKVNAKFTGFKFYGSGGKITSIHGYLQTSYNNTYYVVISVSKEDKYPYELPEITLPDEKIPSECPHQYADEKICIMKSEQWSSTLSIAYIITKVAVWLNKYDYWKQYKIWPGKEQSHT